MESFLGHEVDDFLHFIDTAAEGNHDVEVLEAVFFADFTNGLQFEFKGFYVFGIVVAGRTAPTEEGAAFFRFVFIAAFEVAVFARFKVAQAQGYRARSQGWQTLRMPSDNWSTTWSGRPVSMRYKGCS